MGHREGTLTPITPQDVALLTLDQRERFEERAGIAEYDGGLSRRDAELLAYREVKGLVGSRRR